MTQSTWSYTKLPFGESVSLLSSTAGDPAETAWVRLYYSTGTSVPIKVYIHSLQRQRRYLYYAGRYVRIYNLWDGRLRPD